jgi:class 3 adenylate cyclase
MEQQIRFCTTSDGVRIAYATSGSGEPLVVVPGWVSHLELDWDEGYRRVLLEPVAEHFTVIRYDKRGTGLSDRNVNDFSTEARLRDLEAVVDHLKLDSFALQGISEGGPIAIEYAVRHPERVRALILSSTFAKGERLGRKETRDALVALVRAEWGLGTQTLSSLFMPGATPEEHQLALRYARAASSPEHAAALLEAVYASDVSGLLDRIAAPTLVLHARRDKAIAFEHGRELAGTIPNARLVAFESDRHAPDPATAQQMAQAILGFLQEVSQPAALPATAADSSQPVTILFTDITSSTSLTQRLGDAAAQELVRAHNAIVREALKAHGGSEIKHTGDGIMASFASSGSALQCAIEIQRSVDGSAVENLAVHVGVNAGEPVAEDDDLFGTSVQLARRICDQAEGGEILVSDVVRQLVAGKSFLFADGGDVALRGFEDPVRIYEVRWRDEH